MIFKVLSRHGVGNFVQVGLRGSLLGCLNNPNVIQRNKDIRLFSANLRYVQVIL